jgi:hypothetical protein
MRQEETGGGEVVIPVSWWLCCGEFAAGGEEAGRLQKKQSASGRWLLAGGRWKKSTGHGCGELERMIAKLLIYEFQGSHGDERLW